MDRRLLRDVQFQRPPGPDTPEIRLDFVAVAGER